MSMSRRLFLAVTGAGALGASLRGEQRMWSLVPEAAGKTLKDPDGRIVFTYLTSKPAGVPLEGNSVCCIHPFSTPSGIAATDIAPPDHRDHRGIFLAWHDMSFARKGETLRADFWGWGKFAPTEGRAIVNREVRLARSDASSADVSVANDWMIDQERVLQEATTIRASMDQGARVLELTFRLTPDYDMTINRVAFSGPVFSLPQGRRVRVRRLERSPSACPIRARRIQTPTGRRVPGTATRSRTPTARSSRPR